MDYNQLQRGFMHIQRSMELSNFHVNSTHLRLMKEKLEGDITKEELFAKIRSNAKKQGF